MANWGSAVGRGATGAMIGSKVFPGIGTAVGGGIGFLSGLFSGKDDDKDDDDDGAGGVNARPESQLLRNAAATNRDRATGFHDQSAQVMSPVVDYYSALLGPNPQALMQAMQAERGRVIDQYDTARKSIGEFGPRGGGTTSAMATSRLNEAHDLSDLFAESKRDAAQNAGTIGMGLAGLGLSADQLASADLSQILQMVLAEKGIDVGADLQRRGQNAQVMSGLGSAAGTLLGAYLTRDGGAWGTTP